MHQFERQFICLAHTTLRMYHFEEIEESVLQINTTSLAGQFSQMESAQVSSLQQSVTV